MKLIALPAFSDNYLWLWLIFFSLIDFRQGEASQGFVNLLLQ